MSDVPRDGQVLRRVMWQRLDTPGTEICALMSSPNAPRFPHFIRGYVTLALDGVPMDWRYEILCDASWHTMFVYISPFVSWNVPVVSAMYRGLSLRREVGQWSVTEWTLERPGPGQLPQRPSERELPELAGCIDVDLGISPSTNTLPIRRLNLAIGESRELTAAWVRFPELTIEPLAQRYTRLAERRYRYESTDSGFTAELEVDDLGLVITYETLWQRVAENREEN